ncbi:MAG: 2-dehydropantoate 2-reductase [Halioglobus sp.]
MVSHWHILGAGAIGGLFAASLERLSGQISLLIREGTVANAACPGSRTLSILSGGSSTTVAFPTSTASETGYISHLLISTKAYDVAAAVAAVSHRLDERSHILLMINGMGILETLEKDYPQWRFYIGTTTEGAYRTSKNDIVHAGSGITKIGCAHADSPPDWFDDWAALPLSCHWDTDIAGALWLKMVVNSAINPLTALARCRNGALLSQQGLSAQLESLCDEIAMISAAAGYHVIASELHSTVRKVIADTANNRSSMLQDIEAQRRTEIEYINGYLIAVARRQSVPAPLNEALLQGILKLSG